MKKEKIVVLYHAQCPDGFGAAYGFWKKYGDKAVYIPVSHGLPIPAEAETADVLFIVDFAYSRSIILDLKQKVDNLTVIDHHITAKNDLGDLEFCQFDMTQSGASLAWQYCFGHEIPKLIQYVQARDLWQWELPDSQEILSAIDSYPQEFEAWDQIAGALDNEIGYQQLKREGEAIQRYKKYLMDRIISHRDTIEIAGHIVPVVNTPFFQSEIVAELSIGQPFAAAYYYDGQRKEYIFSLRSKEDGLDVSQIAKFYGGGGHKVSSGFQLNDLAELKSKFKGEQT